MRSEKPSVRVFAAEPETAAPLATSMARGEASYFDGWRASFVDGAGGKSVLPGMWPLLRRVVDESLVMTLDEISDAMRHAAERVHVIAEGAAGCAIAAARSGRMGPGPIVAVVSGGNIDLSRFAELVAAVPAAR
jgi:threonine dehydratase